MSLHYEWLGLISSFLWAIAFIVAVIPVNTLGTVSFNRWRMFCSSLILGSASLAIGGYKDFSLDQVLLMCLSGTIGICIGDIALFASFNRLGPRLSGLLFSTHAFFSVVIGLIYFNESLTLWRIIGILLIFLGISITLYYSEEKKSTNSFAISKISVTTATFLGLLAGLCQALGIAIAKPVVEAGINPIAASSIRMICAYILHVIFLLSCPQLARPHHKMNRKVFGLIFINAFIALGLGMTLILKAVDQGGNLGLVAIFSACTPIMLLPIMWFYYHKKPQKSSWISALLVVIGTGIIFNT